MKHNYKRVTRRLLRNGFLLFFSLFLGRSAYAQDEVEMARQYVASNLTQQKLTPTDVDGLAISSAYLSPTTGWYHVYFNQTYQSIDVYNRMMNVVLVDNQAAHMNHNFIAGIDAVPKSGNTKSVISPLIALQKAVATVGLAMTNLAPIQSLSATKSASGILTRSVYALPELSDEKIDVKLFWLPVESDSNSEKAMNRLALSWQVHFLTKDGKNGWTIHVDATSGEILQKTDAVIHCNFGKPGHLATPHVCTGRIQDGSASYFGMKKESSAFAANSYTVFDYPLESPNHGSRTASISPYTRFVPGGVGPGATNGWHDDGVTSFSITRGNNVWTQEDVNGNDGVGTSPSSATLEFNFPYTKGLNTAVGNRNAAITNLFYWNNLIHDVLYKYGFDEPSGNFQKSNMERGGKGNDHVMADAQDGSGTNNANFYTPADGTSGRMQMYLFSAENGYQPDSDFDNGVISHEYGHGWSTRLTGGPLNSGCLYHAESGGEGWSDFLGLMLTTRWSSLSANVTSANIPRGFATYSLGQSTSGEGIRPYRYSYDMANINKAVTYGKVKDAVNFPQPHGIGSIWATMLWDMTWEIILQDKYIAPNIYTTPTSISAMRGNIAALKLVTEGLRLQPCSPSFVQARDAIFLADALLFGGRYQCAIGKAFARRGLGLKASTGSSSSDFVVTEDFTPFNGLALTNIRALTLCSGTPFSYTATANNTGVTFRWRRAAVSGISNASATGNSARINETLVNTASEPITVQYSFTLTAPSTQCTPTQSASITQIISVVVHPVLVPLVKSYSVCQNTTVPAGEGLVVSERLVNRTNGLLTANSPNYVRSSGNNTSTYTAGKSVRYQSFTFTAPMSGSQTFEILASTFSDGDSYLSLYRTSFNPASPATNFLRGDDDSGEDNLSKLTYSLTQGTTYILVASSYNTGVTGSFTMRASIPIFSITPYNWFATSTGGSLLSTDLVFNPVGITGSGIPNTATPGTTVFYVSSPNLGLCRTATTFTVLNSAAPVASPSTTITLGNSTVLSASGCSGTDSKQIWYQAVDDVAINMPISPTATTQYYARCQRRFGSKTCLSDKSQDVTVTVLPTSYNSAQSGNWDVPTTWSCNCVPDGTLPVWIMEAHIVTVPDAYTAQTKGMKLLGTGRVRLEGTGKLKLVN
ncbi:hypothetical protein GCM10027592_37570 [Spirosoma flavus]